MSTTVSVLALVLTFFSAQGPLSPSPTFSSDRERVGLIGSVRSVRVESIELVMKDSELTRGRRIELTETTYNRVGNEEKWIRWWNRTDDEVKDWKISEKVVTLFNPDGTKRESVELFFDDDGPWIDHRWLYHIDVQGESVELFTYSGTGEVINRCVSTYDSQGKETLEVWYRDNGDIVNQTFFAYDAFSRLFQKSCYEPNGSLIREDYYSYDAQGNLQQEHSDNEDIVYSDYEYDARGNWISRRRSAWWGHQSNDPTLSVTHRTITYY